MVFKQLVLDRFSCRAYNNTPIPSEVLNELFDVCRFAPSAANYQPWQFIIVNEPAALQKIYESYNRPWLKLAPVIIIALANKNIAWVRADGKNHSDVDLSIFINHLILAATEVGLATCWICNFNATLIQNSFSIPEHIEPMALIPIGYPSEGIKPTKTRKEWHEFVYFNSYKND